MHCNDGDHASLASSARSWDASHCQRPSLCWQVIQAAAATAAPPAPPAAMQTVHVDLPGDRRYPIYIGDGLLDRDDLLQRHVPGQRVLVVTNETVAPLYLDRWDSAGMPRSVRLWSRYKLRQASMRSMNSGVLSAQRA